MGRQGIYRYGVKSPYGRLATLTSRQRDRFELIFIHGGLQMLAIPIQAVLIALPILAIEYLQGGSSERHHP